MDASALASAESWLSAIAAAKLVAAFLVAAGVAIEFGGEWAARPFERTVKEAREAQLASLNAETVRLSAEAETARSEIAKAAADVAAANERTAVLAKEAAEARERTAEIEKLTAWRRVNPEQNRQIADAIRDKVASLDILIEFQMGDPEAFSYGREIAKIFVDAGVDPKKIRGKTNVYLETPVFGLHMAAAPEVDGAALARGTRKCGNKLIDRKQGSIKTPPQKRSRTKFVLLCCA